MNKVYAVTGTLHGSIIEAINEGEARNIFHKKYNGESILYVKDISNHNLSNI
jgi:outer membrane lipoprotein SlyB